MSDWMSGYGFHQADDSRYESLPPNRCKVTVVICPECQSFNVAKDTSHGAITYWKCGDCGRRWKEPRQVNENGTRCRLA